MKTLTENGSKWCTVQTSRSDTATQIQGNTEPHAFNFDDDILISR
jgi:hypothetical protein